MTVATAEWIIALLALYFGIGVVFALVFVFRGVSRIDSAAHDMDLPARLLVMPGAVALWPLVLSKWLAQRGRQP